MQKGSGEVMAVLGRSLLYMVPAIPIGLAALFAAGYFERRVIAERFGFEAALFPEPFAETAARGLIPVLVSLSALLLVISIAVPLGVALGRWLAKSEINAPRSKIARWVDLHEDHIIFVYGANFFLMIAIIVGVFAGTYSGMVRASEAEKNVGSGCRDCFEYSLSNRPVLGIIVAASDRRVALLTKQGLVISPAIAFTAAKKAEAPKPDSATAH